MGLLRKLDAPPSLPSFNGLWRKTALDLEYFEACAIGSGAHAPNNGHCYMEALALATGQAWGAGAVCVSEVITGVIVGANDSREDDDERAKMKVFARDILGTAPVKIVQLSLEEYLGMRDENCDYEETEELFDEMSAEEVQRHERWYTDGTSDEQEEEQRALDLESQQRIWVELTDSENALYQDAELQRAAARTRYVNRAGVPGSTDLDTAQVIELVRELAAIMPPGVELLESDWVTPKVKQPTR